MDTPDDLVVLRYFAVQGRAQALRLALTEARVPFDDRRVAFSEFRERRAEPDFAGPYQALPVLSWGAAIVAETLPIASYVARQLGQYDGLDHAAVARLEAISSCCYIDVTLRLAAIIRADLTYPGADLGRSLAAVLPSLLAKLALLEASLPSAGWVGGERPVMPDFFLTEAFEVLSYVLGAEREPRLRERVPRLSALAARVRELPVLAHARETRPTRFTGRPDEDAVLAKLHSADLSTLGF